MRVFSWNPAGEIAKTLLNDMADAIGAAVQDLMVTLNTFWMNINNPITGEIPQAPLISDGHSYTYGDNTASQMLNPTGYLGVSPDLVKILNWSFWIALLCGIVAIIIIGGKIALNLRAGRPGLDLGRIGLILVSLILMSVSVAVLAKIVPTGVSTGNNTVAMLRNNTAALTIVAATVGMVVGVIRIIFSPALQNLTEIGRALLRLAIVSTLSLSLITLLSKAGDWFSEGIIKAGASCSTDQCFGDVLVLMFTFGGADGKAMAVMILIIGGIFAIIASLIQMVILIFRNTALIILAGVLPLTAAATQTEMGQKIWKTALGWTAAFLAFKPAAAIVYAAAFKLASGADGIMGMIQGLTLLIVAPMMLPAMMKLFSPSGGMGAGGGAFGAIGGVALGAAAAAATGGAAAPAMATGAQAGGAAGEKAQHGAQTGVL